MLPVTEKNIIKLDLDKNSFTKNDKKYTKLLKEKLFWLNRNENKIYRKAKKLYNKYIDGTLNQSTQKDAAILNY